MVGVTIADTPKFYKMAQLAAQSVEKHANIPTHIITQGKASASWLWKFELWDMFPNDTVFFFDADTIMVKDVDLTPFDNQTKFIAVKDQYITEHSDLTTCNLDANIYFNSGVMFFNQQHKEIANWVQTKRKIRPLITGFFDQSYFNKAVQELAIPLRLIATCWNYMRYDPLTAPKNVIIGHYTFHNNTQGQRKRDSVLQWLLQNHN